ncbi:hypothetical protein RRG08_030804 [Elysia crispata]|uniref:Uncharacterized protein n=1 Tax=Elysia crispata TaxID=231223 RepID=A0AAE0YG16_9GAST|nr:hypothetical protein RRG08_030804 [Elysia crispata]
MFRWGVGGKSGNEYQPPRPSSTAGLQYLWLSAMTAFEEGSMRKNRVEKKPGPSDFDLGLSSRDGFPVEGHGVKSCF